MSKQRKFLILLILIAQVGLSHTSTLALSVSGHKEYDTTQTYIFNNFEGSLETIYFFFEDFHFVGGLVIGYYLYKYHNTPLTEAERLKTVIGRYSYDSNHWMKSYPDRDRTREGEASFLLEVGIQFPRNKKWKIEPNKKAYIVEKFFNIPILLKWIRPISCWNFDIDNYLSLGCMMRYLRDSTYIDELPECTHREVNLKKNSNMPSLYYDIIFELGLIFPVGIYTSLVCYVPLNMAGSYSTNEDKIYDTIKWHRDFHIKHMFACKLGLDFCRLLKYCKSL